MPFLSLLCVHRSRCLTLYLVDPMSTPLSIVGSPLLLLLHSPIRDICAYLRRIIFHHFSAGVPRYLSFPPSTTFPEIGTIAHPFPHYIPSRHFRSFNNELPSVVGRTKKLTLRSPPHFQLFFTLHSHSRIVAWFPSSFLRSSPFSSHFLRRILPLTLHFLRPGEENVRLKNSGARKIRDAARQSLFFLFRVTIRSAVVCF